MKKRIDNQFSWFLSGRTCSGIFNSIEEAIADAQDQWDNEYEEFEYRKEDDVSNIIHVGPVYWFDWEKAVRSVVMDIDNSMDNGPFYDFAGGVDDDTECGIIRNKNEEFYEKATAALLPIVKEYFFINPEWICVPTKQYNLETKEFVENV
jgi:hypothetical protein